MRLTHATAQGLRNYQEDRFFAKRFKLCDDSGLFLAVMDGHGGDDVSEFCRESFRGVITKAIKDKKTVDVSVVEAIFQWLNERTMEMEMGSTL